MSLSIGEVAGRCGVSIRALRLYEATGLLRPVRSQAGRRCYGADQLARVHQILVLKRAGWTLAEIGRLLQSGPLDPKRLIDMQIGLVEARHAALDSTLRCLRGARARLADGETLTMDLLCDLISTGEQTMTDAAWNDVFARYYTPEEIVRWKQAKAMTDTTEQEDYGRRWLALIARIETAMADSVAPDTAIAVGFAQEWLDLQQPMVEQVGAVAWGKAAQMYSDMEQWQTDQVRAPFSAEVYRFISAAASAGRAQGLIAPRAVAAD